MTTPTQPAPQDILRTEQGSQAAVRRLARIPLAPPLANAEVAFRPTGVACGKDRVYVTISATAPDAGGVQRETPAGHVAIIDGATHTVRAYIPVANAPRYAAVDATTQRVFVTHNNAAGNVAVIDGPSAQLVGELITTGYNLSGIAINATTRRVYLVRGNKIIVLDADNPHVPLPSREITLDDHILVDRLAVDSATNRIFVPAKHVADPAATHWLYVIDGNTNAWTKVTYEHALLASSQPRDVAVDPLHKRIYVSNFGNNNSLSVLDLTDLTLLAAAAVPGGLAADVAVDPLMSLVYVATSVESNLVSRGIGMAVLDAVTTAAFAPSGPGPQPQPSKVEGKSWGMAMVPGSRHVYLANGEDRSVSVVQAVRLPGTAEPAQKRLRFQARLEQAVQAFAEPTPLLPLVMHTLARGIQGAQNKGQLDMVFDQVMQHHPKASRELLGQFVADYRALPDSTRARAEPEELRHLDITQPIGQELLGRIATRPWIGPIFMKPQVTAVEPSYALKGQIITIVGHGFTADSAVQFWGFDPDANYLQVEVKPSHVTASRLTLQLPPQVNQATDYLVVRCTVAGKLEASNPFTFRAHDKPQQPPSPILTPEIASIGGERYPGKDILINGKNLKSVLEVVFQALDPLTGVDAIRLKGPSIIGRAQDGTSIQVRIPVELPPGKYRVFARSSLFPLIESNWLECEVLAYRYKVTFTNFHCDTVFRLIMPWLEKRNRLITMWAVTHDNQGYFKSTSAIETGSDQVHSYGNQGALFPADGTEGKEIWRVLGILNQLFFAFDDYDPQETIQTIGAVSDLMIKGAMLLGQPEIAALFAVLTPVMQLLIDWLTDGSDPGYLWPMAEPIGWSVVELQQKTNNPERMFDGQLQFSWVDDGLVLLNYILHYQVARLEH